MKKKKGIKTFKNWLLARDAASRISTKSNYTSFLESSTSTEIEPKSAMEIFDKITNTDVFYKFQNYFADLGIWKITTMGQSKRMQLTLNTKYSNSNVGKIRSAIDVKQYSFPDVIEVVIDPSLEIPISPPNYKIHETVTFLTFYIKPSTASQDIKIISIGIIKGITESIDFGEKYINDFLRWWVNETVIKRNKFDTDLLKFEDAIVEWMKQVPMEERTRAYYDIVTDKRQNNSSIVDIINSKIKDQEIKIKDKEDIDSGSKIIKRFGI